MRVVRPPRTTRREGRAHRRPPLSGRIPRCLPLRQSRPRRRRKGNFGERERFAFQYGQEAPKRCFQDFQPSLPRSLEVFRKNLMQSLCEDEENSAGALPIVAKPTPSEDDALLPPSRASSVQGQFVEMENSLAEGCEADTARLGISHSYILASQARTPRLTPPASPPSLSASVSPTRTSKPGSPRRHSISFSTSTGILDDRSSIFSSLPSSANSSISSSDAGSRSGQTRVDGREFFRQVRNRLSYEQFGAFLANVKELNAHKQTREETLRKADEIFGPENRDLYVLFGGLISRGVH